MDIHISWQTVITAAAVLAAVAAICAYIVKLVHWIDHQKDQDKQIEELKNQLEEDNQDINEELCLITYGVLACLKGLHEQGCNGPVTEAIGKFDKHINQKAHNQR